ncbi:MAG TPA: LPXTG cell wall anchor domain-containing protein [Chitinophagales bacterium]|nr:LPXTG cell wall anchor domain-containing protein [Chitinophagales bacterium]
MKIFSFFFISIFLFHHLQAQDSLGNISELQKLLKDRKDRFDEYAIAADKRTGIFGNKSKKNLEQSVEILLEIVKTDNNIFNELSHAIVKRGMAKADYSYDQIESKQTIDRLTQAADTLNKQLIMVKEMNASLEKKAGMQKGISYLLAGVILLLLLFLLITRRKKAQTKIS